MPVVINEKDVADLAEQIGQLVHGEEVYAVIAAISVVLKRIAVNLGDEFNVDHVFTTMRNAVERGVAEARHGKQ